MAQGRTAEDWFRVQGYGLTFRAYSLRFWMLGLGFTAEGAREGCRESRRCSRESYPESYITKYTRIRILPERVQKKTEQPRISMTPKPRPVSSFGLRPRAQES